MWNCLIRWSVLVTAFLVFLPEPGLSLDKAGASDKLVQKATECAVMFSILSQTEDSRGKVKESRQFREHAESLAVNASKFSSPAVYEKRIKGANAKFSKILESRGLTGFYDYVFSKSEGRMEECILVNNDPGRLLEKYLKE